MAIEGTAQAIQGIQTAAVGLGSGDPLSTITGILGAVGGTVSVITSFINLFKSFQSETELQQAGLAGQTRASRGDRATSARAIAASRGTQTTRFTGNPGVRRVVDNAQIDTGGPITVINYIEVDGKTTQEIIKTTDRFIQSGRATRRRSPRSPTL